MTRMVWLFGISVFSFFINSISFAESVDHVVVISIDGGKPASIFKSNMPNLKSIIAEGASTFLAETILPSKTLQSHSSMISSVPPEIHKITWNYWNPFKGPIKVPTMFTEAKKQGLITSMFAAKIKFKHLDAGMTKFSSNSPNAIAAAEESAKYLAKKKPQLMFVHMPDADNAGHAYGWESPEQLKALENVDKAIGTIKKAMIESLVGKKFVLIITADHGGSGKDHGSDSDDDRIIPWISWGNVVKTGHKITSDVSTMDTPATVLWLLNIARPNSWHGIPVQEAFL